MGIFLLVLLIFIVQKENKLARLLEEIGSADKMLVFVETKRKADELTRLMRRDGYPAMCIHGNYIFLKIRLQKSCPSPKHDAILKISII